MKKIIYFYDEKIKMLIPEKFSELDPSDYKTIFVGNQPNTAYSNEDKSASISIFVTPNDLNLADIDSRVNQYINVYKNSFPNFKIGGIVKKQLEENSCISVFHYLTKIEDKELLNFLGVLSYNGKELLVSMHCNAKDMVLYSKQFMNVFDSVEIA